MAELEAAEMREPGAHEEDMMADHREIPPATMNELEAYYANLEREFTREDSGGGQPLGARAPGGRPDAGGEAATPRPAPRGAEAEAARLRPEGRTEGAQAADQGSAADLSDFAQRQRTADLQAASAGELTERNTRLKQEERTLDVQLADAQALYGPTLKEADKLELAQLEKYYDEQAKAFDAIGRCEMGKAP
jgi:hypothetical protein